MTCDFSVLLEASGKCGGLFVEDIEVMEFRDYVNGVDFVYLPCTCPQFIWCNNRHWQCFLHGTLRYQLFMCSGRVRDALKQWNKNVVGNIL